VNETQRWALSQLAERCRGQSRNIRAFEGNQRLASHLAGLCDDIVATIDAVLEAEDEEVNT
jgi:hypothetical protein